MSSVLTDQRPAAATPAVGGRRMLVAAAVAGLVALAASALVGVLRGPVRVAPVFADGTRVTQSAWGNAELFGVPGSHILSYVHDTDVAMALPWDGAAVVDARMGERDVHLVTVTDVQDGPDDVVLTLHRDNCRYFHERAIDMFTGVELVLASGRTTEVLFDRPLFVKSPMLASCPDRTLDRQDDTWGGYRSRGG